MSLAEIKKEKNYEFENFTFFEVSSGCTSNDSWLVHSD